MSIDVITAVEPDYVRITATGNYSFDRLFDFIALVKTFADESSRTRALIDCSQIIGDMTEAERFAGGQRIAEIFGTRLKAAVLMPAVQITKLGELAAVNRGAKLLVTSDETEATTWLIAA